MALTEARPFDVPLPWTITFTERSARVEIGRELMPFRVVEAGAAWAADGVVKGRRVTMSGFGVSVDAASLERVDDVSLLEARHFADASRPPRRGASATTGAAERKSPEGRRRLVMEFGPPIVIPGGRWSESWRVKAVDYSSREGPVGIHVMAAGTGDDHLAIRTGHDDPGGGMVAVANVAAASILHDVVLPMTLTVEGREVGLRVGGEVVVFNVLETSAAWRAEATVAGRSVSLGAAVVAPEDIPLERLTNIAALPLDRFT